MKIVPNRTPKKKCDLYKHARIRLLERYGVELTPALYEDMIKKIKEGKALCLMKESHNRTHWLVDDQYIAVFDKYRNGISTFLPAEAIMGYLSHK